MEVTCDHDHTTRTETPATCTEDGSVTVICDDCGEVLSTETLPATGHSTVVKNAKGATCTEPGYTGDKVCTVCGETVKTGEVIPAARPQLQGRQVYRLRRPPIPTPTAAAIPAITAPTAPTPLTKPLWACG